jgi:peroxiredoxin family protein
LRKAQAMAKRTRTRFRESQLFFTRWGLKICEEKERKEGSSTKMKKTAMTSKSTRSRPELRKMEEEERRRRGRRLLVFCSQNSGRMSSSCSIICGRR